MALTLRPIAFSEVGLVRKTNQDSGYVSSTMLLVADGMGGAAAGDLASAIVVEQLRQAADNPASGEEAVEVLKALTTQANATIADVITNNPRLDGMGTTACGGTFDGVDLNVIHIGDSRGYIYSGSTLRRLTHDHSYVQSLIDDGRLDEEAAMNHPHRSLILKVINGQPDLAPDFFHLTLSDGDRIMFCSDGLCGLVTDAQIETVLGLDSLEETMDTLVSLAHAAGGTDNITIAMADVVEVQPLPAVPSVPASAPSTEETLVIPETGPETYNPSDARYTSHGVIGAAADPRVISKLIRTAGASPNDKPGATRPNHAPGKTSSRLSNALRERQRYTPSGRRGRLVFLLVALLIVLGLAGGGWGVYSYVSSQYYIGANQGHVAIYQGLSGSIAGIDTSRLYETTTISLADLPVSWREKVDATIPMTDGLDQARSTVQQLRDKSRQCVETRAKREPGDPIPADGC